MIVDPPTDLFSFVTVWHCEPPEWHEEFRATNQAWFDVDGDEPQRHIWAWVLA